MKPRQGRRVGIGIMVDTLANVTPERRRMIVAALVPAIIAELRKPPPVAQAGKPRPQDPSFPFKDAAYAMQRLGPEPLKPLVTPLRISAERFGRVPRAYIETTLDRVISLESQRRMQAALPCSPLFTLNSDHSPFLSQPDALARILISI